MEDVYHWIWAVRFLVCSAAVGQMRDKRGKAREVVLPFSSEGEREQIYGYIYSTLCL